MLPIEKVIIDLLNESKEHTFKTASIRISTLCSLATLQALRNSLLEPHLVGIEPFWSNSPRSHYKMKLVRLHGTCGKKDMVPSRKRHSLYRPGKKAIKNALRQK